MLSIGRMTGGSESYYTNLAREDYYMQGGEPPGVWWGRGAVKFGLTGTVNKKQLSHLFEGFSVDAKRKLVPNARLKGRCSGFDCTFSAVKSVSILWALSDLKARSIISKAHQEAVEEALSYLEENAAFTRTGAQGVERKRTSNLCVATFEHSTSRALDPNLHTHALVLNLTHSDDGKVRTLDGREIFRHKMAAGALYRAHFSNLLQKRLSLSLVRENSWFEVEKVSKEALKQFSKRRQDILKTLIDSGAIGTSQEAAVVALETRCVKPEISRNELFKKWKLEAKILDLSPMEIEQPLHTKRKNPTKIELEKCINIALSRITEKQSHFSRRDLVRFVAEEAQGRRLKACDIRLGVWAHLDQSQEIVHLGAKECEQRYTTKEMFELEKALIKNAQYLVNDQGHMISESSVEKALNLFASLSIEQVEAVRHLTESGSLKLVSGMAGTGKSFMLGVAKTAFENEGYQVLGLTLAAIASERLEEGSGIESKTIHRFLNEVQSGWQKIDEKTVIVLDEASMVGTRQMECLTSLVKDTGAKLCLIGDERQLQAIDAGAPFRVIGDLVGKTSLVDIRRQNHEWAKDAVREFAEGKAGVALSRFIERDLFHIDKSRTMAMTRLVSDWSKVVERDPKEVLILAGVNQEVSNLNHLCQHARISSGEVKRERIRVGEEYIHLNDRVVFTKNSALIKNGSTGVVTKVNPLVNELTVLLDGGERVTVDAIECPHIQLGYAMTVHKAQGATVDRAFILVGGTLQNREASYVQASRIREEAILYTDEWSAGEKLKDLVRDMTRSQKKDLAHSIIQEQVLGI